MKAEEWCADDSIESLVVSAYCWDGEHHKQWWLEQIAAKLRITLPDMGEDKRGTAP